MGCCNTESLLFLALFLPVLMLFPSFPQCHGVVAVSGERTYGSIDSQHNDRKVYIVYMGEKHHDDPDVVTALHHETLSSVLGSKDAALDSIIYSYKHGFSGFSAKLTRSQAKQVTALPGVLSVTKSSPISATTTRSWDFLGFGSQSQLLHKAKMGEDIIIGVLDTGIWPESKSFDDEGFGPIPSRWKGKCVTGEQFNASHCNRKLIGARYYDKKIETIQEGDYRSARDYAAHGTHTASTAAGLVVQGSNFFGLAAGSARGGAPRARIAVYKVLWKNGGEDDALIAAIDDAIHDGVDILSLSIGSTVPGKASSAGEAFATLHAVQKGITVVYAAGNDGPTQETIGNPFPWVITVAASTMDRSFPTVITLGDNTTIMGEATYFRTKHGDDEFKELYFDSSNCNVLNAIEVEGKIVVCNTVGIPILNMSVPVKNVAAAGGAGVILARYSTALPRKSQDFPFAEVNLEMRERIRRYCRQSSKPVAKISPTRTVPSDSFHPRIAAFSSRGPSGVFPALIKPDIAAPGVRILAAVKNGYELMDGTSMSTPHVSGIVALLKSLHPSWSSAAIKSAIVTTASTADKNGLPIVAEGNPRKIADPFDYGGGHIDPNRAADPGLIYDINPKNYWPYLCFLISGEEPKECKGVKPMYHLNLPSICIPNMKESSIMVTRTVTNVGAARSTYRAVVEAPPGIHLNVTPAVLEFEPETKAKSFDVHFNPIHSEHARGGPYVFGSVTWVNEESSHSVRMPIAVRMKTPLLDNAADFL